MRSYTWEYDQEGSWGRVIHHSFVLNLEIPQKLHSYYIGLERLPTADYSLYVTHTADDKFIGAVAAELGDMAVEKDFDLQETVDFVASFVQGLKYISETDEEGEYPKYPLQTLVDKGGDCEDTSILLVSLLQLMNHKVILLSFPSQSEGEPGHMGTGVNGNFSGKYYSYEGIDYYYLETTGKGCRVGEMNDDYEEVQAQIYNPEPTPLLKFFGAYKWEMVEALIGSDRDVKLYMEVRNWGTATAEDIYIRASYDEWQYWAKSDNFDLEIDHQVSNIQIELTVPEEHNILKVQLSHGTIIADEAEIDLGQV